MTNNAGVLDSIPSWPPCSQLPCHCLGSTGDATVTVDQAINVLQTACPSNDTYNLKLDSSSGQHYLIPRQFNCGTRKPDLPTWASKCECEDMGQRKSALLKRISIMIHEPFLFLVQPL